MKIFPAIDIKDKKCVRLVKGDFDNKTEYNISPIDQATKYKEHGFKNLHIVDLDGALTGKTVNLDIIKEIVSKYDLKIEIGGGIGLYYLIHHSVKVNTEGFALNNQFVTIINEKNTGIDPNPILIQVMMDANLLYNLTPNYTISGGLKVGLPITNTNSELFIFRMYNTGLRISLSKLF